MIKINPSEFETISRYILEISGIALLKGKEYLVETRLGPLLHELECASFSELHYKAKMDFKEEIKKKIIDAISTNETYFFRDKSPFTLIQHKIIPDLIDRRTRLKSAFKPSIRLWSAASSSGQEIYSIAMALDEINITPQKYNIKLLGTDISDAAIAKASYGSYNKFEVARGLNTTRLKNYFNKEDNDCWKIKDKIRSMVQFKKINLMKPFVGMGKFDIILCRNVMIYFTPQDRQKIYANIAKVLEPDGYLILGATESLVNHCDLFDSKRYLNAVFYQLKDQAKKRP